MNTFCFIMMTLIFLMYVGMIWYRFGVLTSISESYYKLPVKQQFLFTLFCWGFAIPAIILGDSVLMFLAGSAICFVGAASAFKSQLTGQVHAVGAVVGMILGLSYIIFDADQYWLATSIVIVTFILLQSKNFIWWTEIVVFTAICITLGMKIF